MTVKPVALPESAKGYNFVVTIDYTDFSATAGLTKTLELIPATTVTAGKRVLCSGIYIETPFAGTTTLTLQVGDGNDTDRFATAAVCDLKGAAGPVAIPYSVTTQPYAYKTADGVDALVTATVENLTSLSAGKAHIFLAVWDDLKAI